MNAEDEIKEINYRHGTWEDFEGEAVRNN